VSRLGAFFREARRWAWLAGLVALLAALWRIFIGAPRARAAASEAAGAAQEQIRQVRAAAERKDGAEVQRQGAEVLKDARRRRGLCILAIGASLTTSALASPPMPDCSARPAYCPEGDVCQPAECDAAQTEEIVRLLAEVADLKSRVQRRWFRPFLGAGLTWAPIDQTAGVYGQGGVLLWRHVNISAEITQDDARARFGWRQEW
jgi:hypothetical protein